MEDAAALNPSLKILADPEELGISLIYDEKSDHRTVLRDACRFLFQRIEQLAHIYASCQDEQVHLSGLKGLLVGEDGSLAHVETMWSQVELQNDPLFALLKRAVKELSRLADSDQSREIQLLDNVLSEKDHDSENNDEDKSDNDVSDEDQRGRIEARMRRAMADMENVDNSSKEEGSGGELQQRTVQHSDRREEESLVDPAAEELNDGFFDIQDMEAFADEEEEYLPDEAYGPEKPEDEPEDKRSFHQRQRDGDLESGSETDEDDVLTRKLTTVRRRKYREDDEVEALHRLYDTPHNDDDSDEIDVVKMTAVDFFGAPNKNYLNKSRIHAMAEKPKPITEGDEESWDDHGFSEKSLEEEEDVERDDHSSNNEEESKPAARISMSKSSNGQRGGQADKLGLQIKQLESEMLAEKPWQMKGEVGSHSRPVNSLLESTPEFEVASKMVPTVTLEDTANLEDVIKKRILNEDWDDVIPRELPDVAWNQKRGEAPEVSQEKSKLGLGELYEREYLKKVAGYDVAKSTKETEEEKAKNEMKSLFANLCSKLDALSNYHFAPRPVAEEAEVRVLTTPAVAMEEVLPLHVSDGRTAAPEEIYGSKRGRDGILRHESELDQNDRKRRRSAKKGARRKARKDKLADEKLISRLQPGLGLNNPYEKRKMREELAVARSRGKVSSGEADTNDYGASGTFFQRLQEDSKKSLTETDNRTSRTEPKDRSAHSLKL